MCVGARSALFCVLISPKKTWPKPTIVKNMRYILASVEKKLYGQVQNLKYIQNYIDVLFCEKVYDYMVLYGMEV